MKVKNKQIILLIFLFAVIGALGLSMYFSQTKIFYSNGNIDNKYYPENYVESIKVQDFKDYYHKKQEFIDVKHYTLKFDLLTDDKVLKGDVTIKGETKETLNEIYLNFYENLIIEKLLLNGKAAEYNNSGTSLIITNKNKSRDFVINIVYRGTPVDLGFGSFVFGEFNGRPVVYTLSEPNYASTWFPCNDLTDDKALADIYITNDSSKVSVSNGYLADVKTNGSKRTYHWKTVYPISTYLISINSADYMIHNEKYLSLSGDSLDLTYFTFPEDNNKAVVDFEDHPKYLAFMENSFGPYPFIKEKYGIAEFLWTSGAMEHQTITGFSYRYYTGKKYFSNVLIHELAHQWWGNAVGPASWKDIWLNEGFAEYSEALFYEYSSGKTALESKMQSIYGEFNYGTLYNPGDNLFSSKVYNKGAWVLHMLRKELSDPVFFEILKEYYKQYKFSNASTNDFKNLCERISGKNLNSFFDQWLYKGSGIISLRYNWKADNENNIIKLNISQTQKGYEIYKFPLEVLVKQNKKEEVFKFYINSRDTTIEFNYEYKPDKIELDPGSWLLAHIWEEKG